MPQIKPGQLNPSIQSKKVPTVTSDMIIDNPKAVYDESLSNLMNEDILAGKLEFQGQVLLSFTPPPDESSLLYRLVRNVMTNGTLGAPQEVFCFVRIPLIHQTIADPSLYRDSDTDRMIKTLLKYPVLRMEVAKDGPQIPPSKNSIVNVVFDNASYRTGKVVNVVFDPQVEDDSLLLGGTGARSTLLGAAQVPTSLQENQAVWYQPSQNREIKRIVLHVTAGNAGLNAAQRTIDYFAGKRGADVTSGKRKVSIHYAVDQGGNVIQGVLEKDIAYHVGKGQINATSVGIEVTGNPGVDDGSEYIKKLGARAGNWPPGVTGIAAGKGAYGLYAGMYTVQCIESLAKLCAGICDRNGLAINRDTITGHEKWWPGAKYGPGQALNEKYNRTDYWNWNDFLSRVKGYSSQAAS